MYQVDEEEIIDLDNKKTLNTKFYVKKIWQHKILRIKIFNQKYQDKFRVLPLNLKTQYFVSQKILIYKFIKNIRQ